MACGLTGNTPQGKESSQRHRLPTAAEEKNIFEIDSSNYCDYYKTNAKGLQGTKLITSWLTQAEVTAVILDELILAKYQSISSNCMYKIDSKRYIVLSAYSRESNFGFLFIDGHYMEVNHRNRSQGNRYRQLLGIDYVQCEETISDIPNFIKIEILPKNIFTVLEDVYWYQYTDYLKDDEFLVSKEKIIKILRQDIKQILAKQ